MELKIEELQIAGYEKVIVVTAVEVKLQGIICVHSTLLGPSLGGIRICAYETFQDAFTDVMRLAEAMTFKAAVADMSFGGAKSVIMALPGADLQLQLPLFAQAIHQLQGVYICAEDVGCSIKEIDLIGRYTPYVVGLSDPRSSGDPSPFTAWGTFLGIQAVLYRLFGSSSLKGRKIALQGLGSVGSVLLNLLFWHGAQVVVSDVDWKKVEALVRRYGVKAVAPGEILEEECDVLSPCALGGILDKRGIARLRCRGIAGSANNQLLAQEDADRLHARGILYAPDFVVNAGGLINVGCELEEGGYNPTVSRMKVNKIYDRLLWLFETSAKSGLSPHAAAVALAQYRIKYGLGKRLVPPVYRRLVEVASLAE